MDALASRLEKAAKIVASVGGLLGAVAALAWAISPSTVSDIDFEKISFATAYIHIVAIFLLILVISISLFLFLNRMVVYYIPHQTYLRVLIYFFVLVICGWSLSQSTKEAFATLRYFGQETYGRAFRRHLIYQAQIAEAGARHQDALDLYKRADTHLSSLRRSDVLTTRITQLEGLLEWGDKQREISRRILERRGNSPESFKRLAEAFSVYPSDEAIASQFRSLYESISSAAQDLEYLTTRCVSQVVGQINARESAIQWYFSPDRQREMIRDAKGREQLTTEYCARAQMQQGRGFDPLDLSRSYARIWGLPSAPVLLAYYSDENRRKREEEFAHEILKRRHQAYTTWAESVRLRYVIFGRGAVRAASVADGSRSHMNDRTRDTDESSDRVSPETPPDGSSSSADENFRAGLRQ